ncbi:3-oxoadipate enol-lactonase [Murinocardiopsis flavida]|uniref:3-oxoadipate enol-lactonase n=1 Tax=Murinocardiopsis flavida TaxID=645275 RepID=A0A2P8DQ06_9ACTN|nr:3-oxoadipate enol-lactonase [Murinocardiopsis flavida]
MPPSDRPPEDSGAPLPLGIAPGAAGEFRGVLRRRGCDLHYRLEGWPGPAVVLCHGAHMDLRMFDAQVAPLVAAGYRVLRWDLRGHGASKPMGRDADVVTLTADLLAVLDATVGAPAVLLGHSYGGFVVQELYHHYPEYATALVLVSTLCTTRPVAMHEWWRMRAQHAAAVALPRAVRARGIGAHAAETAAARAYSEHAAAALDRDEFRSVLAGVRGAFRADPAHRIDAPLLLVRGSADRADPGVAATAAAWARREPDCRYEVVRRAGHNVPQDRPAAFNDILLDFLAERAPARPAGAGPGPMA